jgi:nucleotide-binding universal stress UspA family protein
VERFRSILVGTDFSRASDAALRVVFAMAQRGGARVDVFHAVERPDAQTRVPEARERLERIDGAQAARLHVESAGAGELLHELRQELAPDLVVLGASGLHRLRRMLLGSLCERALQAGGCPLLVVQDAPRGDLFKQILVAVEDPDRAPPSLEIALALAHDLRGELTVVHVLPSEGYVSDSRRVELSPDTVPARLERLVSRLDATIPVVIEVVHGDPEREIARTAHRLGAELVVVGARPPERGGPGPVAERVAASGLPATLFVWPVSS